MDAVRAGIILYGMWPSDEVKRDGIVLEPLLSLKSRIAYIKELDAGQEISYGGTFCTANPMRVATIPVGYADGYPRRLSNMGKVFINGKAYNQIGRICMDVCMADVTGGDVRQGDEAILFGRGGMSIEAVAQIVGTINYELTCLVTERVNRVYVNN